MADEEMLLEKRLIELSKRSYSRSCWTFSDFLNMAEQDILSRIKSSELPSPFTLIGGYNTAERCIAAFGSEEICGYVLSAPCVWIEIKPLQQRFADLLTHRDVLGSLMSLGIKRGVLGDIVLNGNCAYLYCLQSVSEFIISELTRIKHTTVDAHICDEPEFVSVLPDESEFVVSSLRLDSVIASVYKLSRSESKQIVTDGNVYLNSKVCTDPSKEPKHGEMISIRGFGRIEYIDISRETKKGRLRITVRVYK